MEKYFDINPFFVSSKAIASELTERKGNSYIYS